MSAWWEGGSDCGSGEESSIVSSPGIMWNAFVGTGGEDPGSAEQLLFFESGCVHTGQLEKQDQRLPSPVDSHD